MTNFIENMGGIATFGVISICLFVVVFTSALIWAFCQKKTLMDQMQTLPLDDSPKFPVKKENNTHE
jgi:hypothetical protein